MADLPLLERRDARGVVTLTMNRPATFNALGEEMRAALQAALDRSAGDEQVRAVVAGAAGKAFSAGHNLKEMLVRPELASDQQLFTQCSRMMLSIQKLPVQASILTKSSRGRAWRWPSARSCSTASARWAWRRPSSSPARPWRPT